LKKIERFIISNLEIGSAGWLTWQKIGIWATEHVAAVFGSLNAQADPEPHVGADTLVNNALWPLHSKDQVDSERAPLLRDADEFVQDLA
jgi:hypothetical protein